ncbi:hypothetical protein C0416_05110 [bacterium]|nr:hypothetical protein [bacterium]
MRKQVFIGLLAVFTILAVTGCGEEPENADTNQQENVNENPVNEEDNSSKVEQIEDSSFNEDLNAENLDVPARVDDYLLLLNKEDLSLDDCKQLGNMNLIIRCSNKFYLIQALQKLDTKMCDKISLQEEKEDCKKQIQEELKIKEIQPRF